MQQSATVLRSTVELAVGSGSQTASASLHVSRAWVPAIVIVLRAAEKADTIDHLTPNPLKPIPGSRGTIAQDWNALRDRIRQFPETVRVRFLW